LDTFPGCSQVATIEPRQTRKGYIYEDRGLMA
jgi:hypothetical protein